jgi:UPF0716 protein FxsA
MSSRQLARAGPEAEQLSSSATPRASKGQVTRTPGGVGRYAPGVLLKFLFALLGVQLLDLLLLIGLSRRFGFWQTVGTLCVVGLLGSSLARRESARVWRGFQASLSAGRPPEHGVIDGMLVLLAGVLLLLPGILSDVLGLLLFIPPLRRSVAGFLRQRLTRELDLRPPPVMGARRFGVEPREDSAPSSAPAVIDTTGVESPE